MQIDNDGFTVVVNKKKNKVKVNDTSSVTVTQKLIIENEKIKKIFKKYNAVSVLLFGSYSRNSHNENSDINLLILWNGKQKSIINDAIIDIKNELSNIFNKKIDILPMLIKNSNYYNDNYFITNIYSDAIVIYGDNAKDNVFNSVIYKEY